MQRSAVSTYGMLLLNEALLDAELPAPADLTCFWCAAREPWSWLQTRNNPSQQVQSGRKGTTSSSFSASQEMLSKSSPILRLL